MGWRFRRSIGRGPFRINLSKSGLGWSFGRRGARVGVGASGRKRWSIGIPGTGLSYQKGCLVPIAVATGAIALGSVLVVRAVV
ncbi:MAG: DUF4236 domain-containing protein [Phycisphaerales bacterium]|jgi:hypothetical protein